MIKLHFTPKTYIFIAAYCHNVELLTPSTSFHPYRNYDFFCKPYANIRNWCPQCLGIVTQLRSLRYSEVIEFFKILVFQPNCVVILSRINTKWNYLELPDLSSLVPTCFCVQSSCAIFCSQ